MTPEAAQTSARGVYRPDTCAWCHTETWCGLRQDGRPQCNACEVEKFFTHVLYPPFGYRMMPWVREKLRTVYGTLRPDGSRQYRRVYLCVPKKNQKSTLAAGLTAYHLWKAGRQSSVRTRYCYGAASAKDQAGIVYDAARDFIRHSPALTREIRWLNATRRILRRDNLAVYAVISADGDVQDGIEPWFGVIDELHRWKTKKAERLWDVLIKGAIACDDSLIWEITTVGEEFESPLWHEEHEYARKVISGGLQSDSFYAAIYAADEKRIVREPGYWKSREARIAANPSHEANGGNLKDERFQEMVNEAIAKPSKRADYLQLNLNVSAGEGETPEIDMALWGENAGGIDLVQLPAYDQDALHHLIAKWGLMSRPCVAGIDLAWTTDMAGLSLVFPPLEDEEAWKLLVWGWVPEERLAEIERRTRAPLSLWREQGFLRVSKGAEIKTSEVLEQVETCSRMFDVREVTFDRWGGMKAAADLILVPKGFRCIDVPQTFGGLTEGTKKFLALLHNRKLAHANHPILRWHVSCLALAMDGGDNCKPVKPKRATASKRIDLVAATVTAMSRAIALAPTMSGLIEVW